MYAAALAVTIGVILQMIVAGNDVSVAIPSFDHYYTDD